MIGKREKNHNVVSRMKEFEKEEAEAEKKGN